MRHVLTIALIILWRTSKGGFGRPACAIGGGLKQMNEMSQVVMQ